MLFCVWRQLEQGERPTSRADPREGDALRVHLPGALGSRRWLRVLSEWHHDDPGAEDPGRRLRRSGVHGLGHQRACRPRATRLDLWLHDSARRKGVGEARERNPDAADPDLSGLVAGSRRDTLLLRRSGLRVQQRGEVGSQRWLRIHLQRPKGQPILFHQGLRRGHHGRRARTPVDLLPSIGAKRVRWYDGAGRQPLGWCWRLELAIEGAGGYGEEGAGS
mmetsp:Transcript_46015/g.116858  ORF Transcript_46015/g.116858 Transcript_46015/m.116858 type:complete len:220 (-) Transcript_46015:80-739(-)